MSSKKNRIAFYRGKAKISQLELAELTGLTPAAVSYHERGLREPLVETGKIYVQIFRKLGINVNLDKLFPIE